MSVESNGDGAIFSKLLGAEVQDFAMPAWSCVCAGCAGLALPGQGDAGPGAFATTPTDDAYLFVTNAPLQGFGGNVDTLIAGSKWSGKADSTAKTIVSFSFANPLESVYTSTAMNEFQATLTQFSEADKALTRTLLESIEAVCNIDFVEVADNAAESGLLRYGYSQQPNAMNFAGYAFFPSSSAVGGDIWIGAAQAAPQWDFYRPNLILHETLHAIGLKHPHSDGAVLATAQDIIPNTVMSYSPVAGGGAGWMSRYPSEPMALDIAALQFLYGASGANAGNTVYDLAAPVFQRGFHAVWDADGVDVFDASKVGRAVVLDLAEGSQSDVGVAVTAMARPQSGGTVNVTYTNTASIPADSIIENAIGSNYADRIAGNGAANALSGGLGNDRIEGRGGDDALDGGAGLDTAVIDAARAGYSVVKTWTGYAVAGGLTGADAMVNVERLQFTDATIALDLDGNAGTVAKVLGAVFGAAAVHDAGYLGIGLDLVDGGMSYQALMQLALDMRLGSNAGNGAVVDLLYGNVVGAAPAAATRATFVELLDSGNYSQTSLGQMAADHALNLANIDLVGLASTGIEYI